MNQIITTYIMQGIEYLVDIDQGMLIEKDHPANTLAFKNMVYTDRGYKLKFDSETFDYSSHGYINTGEITDISIPHRTVLNPEAMAAKYGMSVALVKTKTDYQVMVNENLVANRLLGNLPVVSLCDMDFTFDLKKFALIPKDRIGYMLHLKDKVNINESKDGMEFFYDPVIQKILPPGMNIKFMPEEAVLASIPLPKKLDPIGVLEKNPSWDFKDMLVRYPVIHEHTAASINISLLDDTAKRAISYYQILRSHRQQRSKTRLH